MSKIKVAELFYSIQGEGRYMGVPSVFLRTFGCNFTCAGFGMPRGQLSEEAKNVDPTQYKSYNELPLVSTGCDSYASWDVRFKNLSPMLTAGIDSPVVFSGSVYQKRLICTNVNARQSLISLFSFCCNREERKK